MKTVIFCPYLSAMWASLAPLYAEHVAAGDNVIVMPIPFTTRDRNGIPMTYRVDAFPVPTVEPSSSWLRDIHPDALYFHYPYDDRNAVTIISREFFSSRLAEYTDDLIYVPYYTMPCGAGGDVDHIIVAPGVLKADHIIVYSEASRAKYIDVLHRSTHADWSSRVIVKNRPKPQTYTMPQEWAEISRGRDLIMLGTSLGAVIYNNAVELAKIRHVIESAQKTDTCLLWRPHPLYDATLTAMLPELRRSYREIVETFIEYQQGILDTSWDLERAVALSSAYIGDPSSVVGFFREQGKPVTII